MPVSAPCMLCFCIVPAHFTPGWVASLPQPWRLVLSLPTPEAIPLNPIATGSMMVPNIAVTYCLGHTSRNTELPSPLRLHSLRLGLLSKLGQILLPEDPFQVRSLEAPFCLIMFSSHQLLSQGFICREGKILSLLFKFFQLE